MAITIVNGIPSNRFLPSANPINITVSSNNNGKCNFRYVCDVYIDNVNVFRFKLFPDPSTGWGFFQLADVISDYLKEYRTQASSAGILNAYDNQNKSIASVYCRFGEEYDNSSTCDGTLNIYPNLATSNTFFTYYGGLDYEEWPSFNHNTYVVDWSTSYSASTKSPKFMTKRPRGSATCGFADSYYLEWMAATPPNFNQTRLVIQKDDGQSTFFNSPSLTSFRRFRAACGPFNINKAMNSPWINSSTKWYDVWIEDSSKQLTEKFRIELQRPTHFRSRIGFIGSLGAPEYVTFYHRNRTSYSIDRKTYKKYLTSHKGAGVYSYNVGDESNTVWNVSATEQHLVSTFVDTSTSKWLYELWLSPSVWIETHPRMWNFRVFRESSSPTSRMLFWLPDGHDINPGDSFFSIPDNKSNYVDYINRFTAISVNGNVVDCGLTYNIYNLTNEACGWIVKDETAVRLPIVLNDSNVEVKQKEGKQIQYTLTYQASVSKTTLRS